MATISISRKEIEKEIKLSDEIIGKINMLGVPAEIDNENLNLEVLPNRPDLLSMQGFLRAINAFIGKEQGLKKYTVNKPEKNYRVKVDSSLKDIRPFTACAIVRGLKFDDAKIKEIVDIQEKLHTTIGRNRKKAAIGVYPLEKISLPIKFEARKPMDIKFIPLEMTEEMNGLQILQRHPTGREYAKLLEGKDRYPVFVDAKGKILSMPPVINSHETGKITAQTRDVFIECSGFDFKILNKILNIIVTALADMGGKIYAMELDYGKKEITPNLEPEKIKIDINYANRVIGLDLKDKDLEKLLPKMGYDYKKGEVLVPAWRADIIHQIDIVEDIAIAYGYDKLIPEIPRVATIAEESGKAKIEKKVSEILSGLGLLEVSSLHLIKEEEYKKSGAKDSDKIEVADSKTDFKILRPNLIIPALRMFAENKDHEYPQKIFEIGITFEKDAAGKSETGINEKKNLVISCSPGNFTEIKQILDYLMRMLKVKYELLETNNQYLIEGRTGSIILDGKRIGFIGEASVEMLRAWNIKMPLSFIEISLEEIFRLLANYPK